MLNGSTFVLQHCWTNKVRFFYPNLKLIRCLSRSRFQYALFYTHLYIISLFYTAASISRLLAFSIGKSQSPSPILSLGLFMQKKRMRFSIARSFRLFKNIEKKLKTEMVQMRLATMVMTREICASRKTP